MNDLAINTQNRIGTSSFLAPTILLNAASGNCKISGKSLVSNPLDFYRPVFEWLESYINTIGGNLSWDFHLDYFNSSSKKMLIALFKKLKNYQEQGGNLQVNWHCFISDLELIEDLEDISFISNLEINVLYKQDS